MGFDFCKYSNWLLPAISLTLCITLLLIGVFGWNINTTERNMFKFTGAIFGGVFASSFSNYIQTICIERHQENLINNLAVKKLQELLATKKEAAEISENAINESNNLT